MRGEDLTKTVDILLLEDSTLDADLAAEHLRRGGIDCRLSRVWTREDFVRSLEDCPDLILADYTLPAFDGMSALEIARDTCPDIPFIFLSATLGEEVAVEAMQNGATDYVVKSRMNRLANCVTRALQASEERKARQSAEAALRASRTRLDAALDIARLGTFEWQPDCDTLMLDGRSAEIAFDAHVCMSDFLQTVHKVEREAMQSALNRLARDGGRMEREFSISSPDGELRDVMMICDKTAGGVAYGILFDVTERRAAERQQRLIMRELHHRVKNSLASVQSIVNFTLRTSDTMDTFATSIRRRIRSLAISHTLLTDNDWSGIRLRSILLSEVQPYDSSRVTMTGPDLQLPAEMALSFALAIHEMTTNAAKYGALSAPAGRVDMVWSVRDGMLIFDWTESGGPKVSPPTRRGFGSILLEQALGQQTEGKVTQDFDPDGLRIHIAIAISGQ